VDFKVLGRNVHRHSGRNAEQLYMPRPRSPPAATMPPRAWLLCLVLAVVVLAVHAGDNASVAAVNASNASNATAPPYACNHVYMTTGDVVASAFAVFFFSAFIVDFARAD